MADLKETSGAQSEWNADMVLDPAFWIKTWSEKGAKSFHLPYVCGWLKKHADKMLKGKQGVRVLVPFCGKDLGMKWLADQGHHVVGIECAEKGCREFFTETNTEFVTEKKDKFTIFRNKEGTIKLYCGDFYDFSEECEGKFGGIWDRGGLTAVNKIERTKYVDLLHSVMSRDAVYILISFDSDNKAVADDWDVLTDDALVELFGARFTLQLRVEYADAVSQNEGIDMTGMEEMTEKLTIITLK